MRKSLRLRLLLGAAIWISAALIVAGVTIASLLRDFVERGFDERLNTNLIAVISAVSFDESGTLIAEEVAAEADFSQPFSGWYWQIADGRRVLLRSPSLWDANFGPQVGQVGNRTIVETLAGPTGEMLRASIRDFTVPGGSDVLRVTVAGPASEIDEAVDTILAPLLLSLAALGIGLIVAVLLQIGVGLRPLDHLRHGLVEVRRGKEQRLPDAGYAELQPLIGELNALLDHNSQVIARARTHVGNLAHGLKTPLAILANAVAQADRDPDGSISEAVKALERLVLRHLRRARSAASRDVLGTVTPVAPVLADLQFAMQRIHADSALEWTIDCPDSLLFAGERHDLEEMLGNILDNACKWARSRVVIRAAREPGGLSIAVEDDGPGLAAKDQEKVVARGVRLDESAPGFGLGLAIVTDLAHLYGGHLVLGESRFGGLEARLFLPAI